MEIIALTIDGKRITSPAGSSLLTAAEHHGIQIPRLCHHPDLKPYGACRMCLVEDIASGRLMAACVTPVAAGMEIETTSPRVVRHRQNIVRLMMAEHPESCIVCAKGNRCQLRQAAANLGIGETDLYPMPNPMVFEEANPFMVRDLSKCILCGRCIRADHELVGVGAIDYKERGFACRPATAHERGLAESTCTFCGTCLSLCPTGALSPKNRHYVGSPEKEMDSVCGFCGVGCRLTMGTIGERVVEVNPAHRPGSVNGATLCVRGHFAHDFLNSSRRLAGPLRRNWKEETPELVPVSWEEALELVASRLLAIKDRYGPQSIGFMGSSKCSLEENYLFQKIARVCVGTNNVDCGGHIYGQGLAGILDEVTDGGIRLSRLADLDEAEAILVVGADPGHSVPVVAYHLKRAARNGVPLVVLDPRRTELVNLASIYLPVDPGGDAALLTGLAALLLEKGAIDQAFIDRYTKGFAAFKEALSAADMGAISRYAGVAPATIEAAADLLKDRKIAFVIGHGVLQQRGAENALGAILNLSLLRGSLGGGQGGILLLAKENNQPGALDMGATPGLLPGHEPLGDGDVRRRWEQHWQAPLSPQEGLNMTEMMAAAEAGSLKALYIMGENPLTALPQRERVLNAFSKLDLLVVQDILTSDLTAMADVVLAGAAMAEKAGAFTNLEGRIQSFHGVVPPPGGARADWQILTQLYARLKGAAAYDEDHDSLDAVRAEIRRCVPLYADLDGREEAWVQASAQKAAFTPQGTGPRIAFEPVAFENGARPDADADTMYPFIAIVGTQRYHLGSGTRTRASERIQAFGAAGQMEISPEDATALALEEGDLLLVRSAFGEVQRPLRITSSLKQGHLFVPTGVDGNNAMQLFGLTPAGGWKSCAVSIEKA